VTASLRSAGVATLVLAAITIGPPSAPSRPEASSGLQGAPSRASLPALQTLLDPGGPILRDRNGDGTVDLVDASIVVPEAASPAEIAAAANIAARLGFESAEMNLPMRSGGRVTIVVGAGALTRAGLTAGLPGIIGSPAGEGLIQMAGTADRPALAIAGSNDEGTRAAGEFVAERFPFAWDVKGATLAQILKDTTAFLEKQSAPGARLTMTSVRVRAGGDAIERLSIAAAFDSPAQRWAGLTALRAARASQPAGAANPPALDYPGVRLIRFTCTAPGMADVVVDVERRTPPALAPAGRRAGGAKESLDLSSLYANEGLLGDGDSNLIPDRTEALLVIDGPGTDAVINLAARIGLESTGVSLPLVYPAAAIEKPGTEPTLVLIGTTNRLVDQLVTQKKFDRPALTPGEGVIQIVPKAFGDKSAVIITGADRAGLQRAIQQAAERLPHIWPRGKDRPTLEDVEEDARTFFAGRSPAGQAAIALYKLDQLLAKAPPVAELSQVVVHVAVDRPATALGDVVRKQLTDRFTGVQSSVSVEDLHAAGAGAEASGDRKVAGEKIASKTIAGKTIAGAYAIPWEVDEFRSLVRTNVIPAIRKRQAVAIEARLSESPEIRAQLVREVKAELLKAGADSTSTVTVLCAYKQGFSWLYDVVRPALAGKPVDRIRIRFAQAAPPPEWTQQAMLTPTRWLLELFPIDEVLARDLRLDRARIVFEKAPAGAPTYQAEATAKDGTILYAGTFTPTTVVRPYFDRFPDYEKVRVSTGWITATVGGVTTVNQRIVTDPERVWDIFQAQTLPRMYDEVMRVGDGKPRPEDAPHFGELTVDVSLSEPEYNLGIDQERISSLESLHEDVYFATLHFFDVLGKMGRGQPLDYPGHVVPIMRLLTQGGAGRAAISFTGFTTPRPMVSVECVRKDGRSDRLKLDVPKAAVERPAAVAAFVRDGADGIDRLDLRLKVDTEKDEREALVRRARAERVDEQMLSAEQVAGTVAALGRLRAAGAYRDALAYPELRGLRFLAHWTPDPSPATLLTAALPDNGTPAPLPDIATYAAPAPTPAQGPMVPPATALDPAQTLALLAQMARFKEATVYKAGESYLGCEIWAMDLTTPVTSSHWSQAKATTLKPTALFTARQHANEVSSTTHVLQLAELLLTDEAYRKTLDKVNVVIHPITNADGAQIVADLARITPDYMLHAGYLGSLGVDVTTAQWEADAIYPESKIRAQLWRTWLPDLYLNPHGYPSHEWVQLFSEYAGWVRNRVTESRDWWGMRGWFMPGFSYIDDPKYPRHKDAAMKIRAAITQAINGVPEVKALNARAYDRYKRYGFDFDPENFKLDFTDDVLIYSALKGGKANPRGTDPMSRQPNITVWSGTTEAPDEPASGDWMTLVASAGLAWDKALVNYLAQGRHDIERKRDAFWGGVTLSLNRPRPPKDKPDPPDGTAK